MKTFVALLAAFTIIPIVDLALLFTVGHYLGGWNAFAIVIATGAIGAWLARRQGTEAWRNVRLAMEQGKLPGTELLEAVVILIAGVLLVTPGLLTDSAGFLLLWPWLRRRVAGAAGKRLAKRITPVGMGWQSAGEPHREPHSPEGEEIIDVKATSEIIDD